MDIKQPHNEQVLRYLSRRNDVEPGVTPRENVMHAYDRCGSHPDVVARIWDEIGSMLPSQSLCLVCGTPAIVHVQTGVILAIAIGTQYCLRLPGGLAAEAIRVGAKTCTVWAGGSEMDTRRDLGEDWVFGAWLREEPGWCMEAYGMFTDIP
jgi:hypothetical protein